MPILLIQIMEETLTESKQTAEKNKGQQVNTIWWVKPIRLRFHMLKRILGLSTMTAGLLRKQMAWLMQMETQEKYINMDSEEVKIL